MPLTAVVRDRRGIAIRGLTRDRFRIFDGGRLQKLSGFDGETAPERLGSAARPSAGEAAAARPAGARNAAPAAASPRPRYVALLFDDVNSERNDLAEARNAVVRFMHEELGPGDRVALFTASSSQSLGFTRDRAALARTIAEIAPHPRWSMSGISTCPRITPYDAYLIAVVHDPAAEQAKSSEAAACPGGGGGLFGGGAAAAPGRANACGLNCTFGLPDSAGDAVEMQAEATWEMERGIAQNTLAAVRFELRAPAGGYRLRVVVLDEASGALSEFNQEVRVR